MIESLEAPHSMIQRFEVNNLKDLELHKKRCKQVLSKMRKNNIEKHNPPDYLADSLDSTLEILGKLVFEYVVSDDTIQAILIGHTNDDKLTIHWLLSNRAGDGRRLILEAKQHYNTILLSAVAYGYKEHERNQHMAKLLKYYMDLGFGEAKEFNDEYGVPLIWHRAKN
jgi:hypothetical protein